MRRRDMLAAGAAAVGLGAAQPPGARAAPASPPPRAFTSGPLAVNPLGRAFAAPPSGLRLPEAIALVDEAGRPRRFSDLRGRPALVSLWAEWCAPCLAEAHDLATLAARAPPGVEVLAVLTASNAKLDGRGRGRGSITCAPRRCPPGSSPAAATRR